MIYDYLENCQMQIEDDVWQMTKLVVFVREDRVTISIGLVLTQCCQFFEKNPKLQIDELKQNQVILERFV